MSRTWESWLASMNQQPRRWLIVLAFLFAMQISPYWYPTPDSCCYLSIARSMAAGHAPANLGSSQLYYAPGYPALISPVFLLSARPFLWLAIEQWLFVIVFILGVYHWTRRLIPSAALLITALATVNSELWCLYRRPLSEIAFMAVLIWLMNLLNGVLREPTSRAASLRILAASALLAGLVAIRQAGVVVAGGFAVAAAVETCRGKIPWLRAVTMSSAIGLPAAMMFVGLAERDRQMAAASQSVTYIDHVRDTESSLADQMIEGVRLRISEIGRLMIPGMYKSYARHGEWRNINLAIYIPWFVMILWGWSKLARRTEDVFALTFPFYVALYIIWPFDQATRFFVPMLPLLMVCLWLVVEPFVRSRFQILTVLLALHGAVAVGYWIAMDVPRARNDHAQWAAVDKLTEAVRGHEKRTITLGVRENLSLMLQYDLDRPVRDIPKDMPIPEGVDRMIIFTAGEFQLFSRKSSITPLVAVPAAAGSK